MGKVNVLVIGSGGREHALTWKVQQSPRSGEVYVAPGNGGTAKIAKNVTIQATDIDGLINFAKEHSIDLTIVGPDDPLAAGIVDAFQAADLKVFGPTKAAAQIESSKSFSKDLMKEQSIPTATYKVFDSASEAKDHLESHDLPVVVKASGLALGKGVYVCQTKEEALLAIDDIMVDQKFGSAGNEVVIEEFMTGPEVSAHALCDGESFVLFPPAQDHKPIFEGNKGPNTGGMGVYSPLPWLDRAGFDNAASEVVNKALTGLKDTGTPFTGCLYPGLMMTPGGPKVLEYNARFGDPETQVYMRLLDSDLLDLIEACVEGRLSDQDVSWKSGFAVTVVLASGGYPGDYKKGIHIKGVEEAELEDVVVFHAGTKLEGEQLVTSGGRVLNVTATGNTLEEARVKAYAAIERISFEGMYYRKDIGLINGSKLDPKYGLEIGLS